MDAKFFNSPVSDFWTFSSSFRVLACFSCSFNFHYLDENFWENVQSFEEMQTWAQRWCALAETSTTSINFACTSFSLIRLTRKFIIKHEFYINVGLFLKMLITCTEICSNDFARHCHGNSEHFNDDCWSGIKISRDIKLSPELSLRHKFA